MKKWMYIIFPGALLGLFLIAYMAETKKQAQREKDHIATVERQKKEKEAKDTVLREKAEADAKKRADERTAKAKEKEDQRLAEIAKAKKDIQDVTDKSAAEVAKFTKLIAQAESDLKNLQGSREKAHGEYLDLLKKVEKARNDGRMAEIETQRTTEMIAKRALESSMTKMPPPPPPPKAS